MRKLIKRMMFTSDVENELKSVEECVLIKVKTLPMIVTIFSVNSESVLALVLMQDKFL